MPYMLEEYSSERTLRNRVVFVGEMVSSHDWWVSGRRQRFAKSNLRLDSIHDLDTNEQFLSDRLSPRGR